MKISRERTLLLPGPGSPRWIHPQASESDLIYLGWGHRNFRRMPVAMHYKLGWTVCVVMEGVPIMVLPEREVELAPGCLMLAGPDCVYGWRQERGRPCEVLVWIWSRPFDAGVASLAADGFEVLSVDESAREGMIELHRRTRREIASPDRWSEDAFAAIRALVQIEIGRLRSPATLRSEAHRRVDLARQWMGGHLELSNPVAALADYLQISTATLHRLFKEQLGRPPGRVFRELKLLEARRLISEEGWLVKQAAARLGYRHANDLSRALNRGGRADAS